MTSTPARVMPGEPMPAPPLLRRLAALAACWAVSGPAPAMAELPDDGVDRHGVRFEAGFPITRPDRVFPLSQIQRGQRGVGYTVFAADELEPFGVEVLGVLEGMLGPGEDVILAKLTGDNIAFTGVISGMSGSPVYIDGKLVGAVSYRFGAFAREPIAGITPIERMLPLLDKTAFPARSASSSDPRRGPAASPVSWEDLGRAPRDAVGPVVARLGPSLPEAANEARPILTPLSGGGLHPVAAERMQRALVGTGVRLNPGGGGARTTATTAGRVPAAPLRPGAPIAALLAQGDVNLSAIGTVTYVHDNEVLAFGHPFVGQGAAGFPMATAAIINTLASPRGSYKQGLAAAEVGVVSQDRLTAISGRLGGPRPPLVPLEVVVRDADGTPVTTRVEMVDEPRWLAFLTDTVVASAVLRRLDAEVGGTVRMKAGYEVGERYLVVEDAYAAPSPIKVAAYAARDAATLLSIITRNDIEAASIQKVRVELDIETEVRIHEIRSVRASPLRVRPGAPLTVRVELRNHQGGYETHRLELIVPEDASPGSMSISVGGGLELDRRDQRARGRTEPRSLDDLLGRLADRRPAQALYARLYLPRPGVTVGSQVLSDVPLSVRAALASQPELGARPSPERPGPEARTPMRGVVTGSRNLSVEVLKRTVETSRE